MFGKLSWDAIPFDQPIPMAASLAVILVILIHVYIVVLEMFLWTTALGRRAFGLSEEFARQTRAFAANQGLYNLFLVIGLLWGLSFGPSGELTRLIFAYKQTVAVDLPLANRIEQVSSENSTLPVHVGATAYYDGEVKTFMEIWGDWIYIGAMVFGFAGSVVAAMFGRSSARSRAQANNLLGDLLGLLSKARAADSRSVLDDIEHQADVIFAATVSGAAENRIDPGAISTFSFAFDQVRKAIDDRRKLV